MKLDIEYHYQIVFIPYRHQNERRETGAAHMTLDIREVNPEDAPVVMKVGNPRDTKDEHGRRYMLKEDGSLREIRFFDGNYFVESVPASTLVSDNPKDIANTFFGRAKVRASEDGLYPTRIMTGAEVVRKNSTAATPLRKFVDDKGEAKGEELRKFSRNLIIVDGTTFEFTPEPIVKIGRYGEPEALVMPRPHPKEKHGGSYGFYDLEYGDNKRAALKHADSIRGFAASMPAVEVLDPSRSTFDGASYDTVEACESLMSTLRSSIKSLHWEALEAFYMLRDAFRDSGKRVTPRLVDALYRVSTVSDEADPATVEAVCDRLTPTGHWTGHRPDRIYQAKAEYLKHGGVRWVRETAAEILDRWSLRPAEAYFDVDVPNVSSVSSNGRTASLVLSEGQATDAAIEMGIDPGEVLDAAANGNRILLSEGRHLEPALAALDPDGTIWPISLPEGGDVDKLFGALATALQDDCGEEQDMILSDGEFMP